MKRILLFLATNVAILVVLSIVMRLLGVDSLLAEQGTRLDFRALLIFSAVIGFAGSLISLAISKWSAKRLTGAKVIETPRNGTESWLRSVPDYRGSWERRRSRPFWRMKSVTLRTAIW